MISTATVITVIAVGFAGATTVVAATVQAGREHRAEPAPVAPHPPLPEPDAHLACHTTICAHKTRPHDRTAAGLTCRNCGTTREEDTHA